MGIISLSGLLLELIAEAITDSSELGTKLGLKKIRLKLDQREIRDGNSAYHELDDFLSCAFLQSMDFVLEEIRDILKQLENNKLTLYEIQNDYDLSGDLENVNTINELELIEKAKKILGKESTSLLPESTLKKLSSTFFTRKSKQSTTIIAFDKDVKNTLQLFQSHINTNTDAKEKFHWHNLGELIQDASIQQLIAGEKAPLTYLLLNHFISKKGRLAFYGSAYFSFLLKNNPTTMNLLQTHFLIEMREDVAKLVQNINVQSEAEIQTSIRKYLASIKDMVPYSIHQIGLHGLPICLDPGGYYMIGLATLLQITERRIVIHGPPGCGKTTMLRRILATTTESSPLIPVFLSLTDSIKYSDVKEIVKMLLNLRSDDAFREIESGGNLLFLIDGLNEAADIPTTTQQVSFLSQNFAHSRFLVTSRTNELLNESSLLGFTPYLILPLEEEAIYNLVDHTIKTDEKRDNFKSILKQNKHVREMCSNQLIFLMCSFLFNRNELDVRSASEIYNKFIESLLGDWERYEHIDQLKIAMEKLAVAFAKSDKSKTLVDKNSVEKFWTSNEVVCTQDEFKTLVKAGIIELTGHTYRFFQETLQEYLIACWMIRQGIYPKSLKQTEKNRWHFDDSITFSELSINFYKEMTGIQEFTAFFAI